MSDPPSWRGSPPATGRSAQRSRVVEPNDIVRFTEMSGDRNPIHYDTEAAAKTPFGSVVVQGGVITAILNAVVAEDLPGPGTVFLNTNLDFLAPVRPGDTITGRVELTSVRTDKPICEMDVTVTRDDGTVSVRGTAVTYTFPI